MSKTEDCPELDAIAICERIARLEVKMNIIGFIAGAGLVAALATLIRVLG